MKKYIENFNLKSKQIIADKYVIDCRIGKGWQGEVYRAKEISTKIERTLKLFYPHRTKGLLDPSKYAKKLHHLRDTGVVIPFHGLEEVEIKQQKVKVLVSDYVDGIVLKEFIKARPGRRLHVFQGVHLLYALISGIAKIQYYNEYHGDLHAENIIVKRHGLSFDLTFLDLFLWDVSKKINMEDDVYDAIRIFYDAIGGSKYYKNHPYAVKDICCGLRKSLIKKKFKSAEQLKFYLENLVWDD